MSAAGAPVTTEEVVTFCNHIYDRLRQVDSINDVCHILAEELSCFDIHDAVIAANFIARPHQTILGHNARSGNDSDITSNLPLIPNFFSETDGLCMDVWRHRGTHSKIYPWELWRDKELAKGDVNSIDSYNIRSAHGTYKGATIVAPASAARVVLHLTSLSKDPLWEFVFDKCDILIQNLMNVVLGIVTELLHKHTANSHERISLTPSQLDILKLYSIGFTQVKIAEIRGSSINTIKTHTSKILDLLGVRSTTAAVARAFEERLL